MDEGLILGRYRPLAEIGEGGHGAVDLAFDTKMARRVAIKRIPITRRGVAILATTTGLREARTAALLNHPNIVTVHEWDTDDDEAFLIMEHVDGASLAEVLAGYAPLDLDEAAAVLAQVADAVGYAHDNGVLHLDLKPENVLVTREGLVKVGDFGVAALTNAAGQAISAGGTLGYMPPEQLRGEEVDARTDVWAFAALAFEVLTGAVPYASSSVEGALFKIERTGVPSPRDFVRGLPAALDRALMTALAADPADRPGDIREFAGELLATLGDPAVGRERLRVIANELTAEDELLESEEPRATLDLWNRLAARARLAERVLCALACAWLAWSGVVALGLGQLAGGIALVLAAATGWFAPELGLGAAVTLLAAGAFATSVPLGVAVAVAGALWWYFVGRTRPAAGVVPVFAPLAGALHLSPALPLLAGFFLEGRWEAAGAGAMSGAVLALTSVAGRSGSLLEVAWQTLVHPLGAPGPAVMPDVATWLRAGTIVLAWALAGLFSSIGARRATRLGALVGSAAGLAACAAAVGPWMTGTSRMESAALLQIGLASILVVVVIALGPPARADGADMDEGPLP